MGQSSLIGRAVQHLDRFEASLRAYRLSTASRPNRSVDLGQRSWSGAEHASMKGPLESRHTSSERSAPGLSSHPGARSERVPGSD